MCIVLAGIEHMTGKFQPLDCGLSANGLSDSNSYEDLYSFDWGAAGHPHEPDHPLAIGSPFLESLLANLNGQHIGASNVVMNAVAY